MASENGMSEAFSPLNLSVLFNTLVCCLMKLSLKYLYEVAVL